MPAESRRFRKSCAALAGLAALGAEAGLAPPARAAPLDGKPTAEAVLAASTPADWRALDPENLLYIELERGRVIVALSAHFAPAHAAQLKTLVRAGYYDGLRFYRVIDGFVAQGGDPFGTRDIGAAAPALPPEFDRPLTEAMGFAPLRDADGYAAQVGFVDALPAGADAAGTRAWLLHCAGAFAFGRENDPDTASTAFYITLQPQRYLDRNLSVVGRVVQGMERLQALRRIEPPQSREDDAGETILSMRIAADLPQTEREGLEILASGTPIFAAYAQARRNRAEGFFVHRPDHLDICQLPVPVRASATPAERSP